MITTGFTAARHLSPAGQDIITGDLTGLIGVQEDHANVRGRIESDTVLASVAGGGPSERTTRSQSSHAVQA